MSATRAFGTFFLPGPTEVRDEIMGAMIQPMIPHRGSQFEQLFERLQHGLRPLFMTDQLSISALPPRPE
jgi:aspartate aminotransferase-like enzyme